MFILHERYEAGVSVDVHDEEPLSRIPVRIRMLHEIQHISAFDMKHDLFE